MSYANPPRKPLIKGSCSHCFASKSNSWLAIKRPCNCDVYEMSLQPNASMLSKSSQPPTWHIWVYPNLPSLVLDNINHFSLILILGSAQFRSLYLLALHGRTENHWSKRILFSLHHPSPLPPQNLSSNACAIPLPTKTCPTRGIFS